MSEAFLARLQSFWVVIEGTKPLPTGLKPVSVHYGRTCAVNRARHKDTLTGGKAAKRRFTFFASPR